MIPRAEVAQRLAGAAAQSMAGYDYAHCQQLLEIALEFAPNEQNALSLLALLRRRWGDLAGALHAYRALRDRYPDDIGSRHIADVLAGAMPERTVPRNAVWPAPFVVVPNLLPEAERDAIFATILNSEGSFVASEVFEGGESIVSPASRASSQAGVEGASWDIMGPRLMGVLPVALPRLALPQWPIGKCETQLTRHGAGDFFVPHIDIPDQSALDAFSRRLSFVYYLHKSPAAFRGGALRLYDTSLEPRKFEKEFFTRIVAEDNQLVLFRSDSFHEVEPIEAAPDLAFEDGRFAIGGWFHEPPAE